MAGIDLAVEYNRAMAAVVPIPDSKAIALRARHFRKVELFKAAKRYPGAPVWTLRLRVLWASVFSVPIAEKPHERVPPAGSP